MRKGHEINAWGQTVLTLSRTAFEGILGVSVSLLLNNIRGREATLPKLRGLAYALTLLPNGRRDEPPWTKERGFQSLTPQVYEYRLSKLSRVGSQLVYNP